MIVALVCVVLAACDFTPTSDQKQQAAQEKILDEGTSQVGMPGITHFRERKILKDIYELRDQSDYSTFTYLYNEFTGKKVFFCNSIGYAIPYATQFTNPSKIVQSSMGSYQTVLPQADPNGLFSPASADGTWVMCKDPHGDSVKPVYVEPKVITSPFPMPDEEVKK